MIRRALADGELHIPQDEHARQAGRLAALLRPYPGDAVVRAVALHDAGWPHPSPDFLKATPQWEAWRRSIAIARSVGAFEALIVSRHFTEFSPRFAEEMAPRQAAWRRGVDPAREEAGVAVIQLCDAISLTVLCDPDAGIRVPAPFAVSPQGVIDPWPFRIAEFEDVVTGHWAQSDQMAPNGVAEVRIRFRPKSLNRND